MQVRRRRKRPKRRYTIDVLSLQQIEFSDNELQSWRARLYILHFGASAAIDIGEYCYLDVTRFSDIFIKWSHDEWPTSVRVAPIDRSSSNKAN